MPSRRSEPRPSDHARVGRQRPSDAVCGMGPPRSDLLRGDRPEQAVISARPFRGWRLNEITRSAARCGRIPAWYRRVNGKRREHPFWACSPTPSPSGLPWACRVGPCKPYSSRAAPGDRPTVPAHSSQWRPAHRKPGCSVRTRVDTIGSGPGSCRVGITLRVGRSRDLHQYLDADGMAASSAVLCSCSGPLGNPGSVGLLSLPYDDADVPSSCLRRKPCVTGVWPAADAGWSASSPCAVDIGL